ncbi:Zn-ribbon domain-containing OB-fold protein [Mycobacterium sp. NPDC003449]
MISSSVAGESAAPRIPLVDYLVVDETDSYLVARECDGCGARYFDRRNACARCFQRRFHRVPLPRSGSVRTFTIVHAAAPGITVPFVAAVIDCGGTSVRANVVNVPPDAEHVRVHMPVRLVTMSLGLDDAGREAVGFGFEPDTIGSSE